MTDCSASPIIVDLSQGQDITEAACEDLLAVLDRRSFEYFNQARQEQGMARLTSEEWKKLKEGL